VKIRPCSSTGKEPMGEKAEGLLICVFCNAALILSFINTTAVQEEKRSCGIRYSSAQEQNTQ